MRCYCQYRFTAYRPFLFLCSIFLFFSFYSIGQRNKGDWKSRIDYLVDEIDSLAMKTQRTFIVTKYLKNNDPYKETWHYTLKGDKIVYFEIRYVIENNEFTEIFYVDRNRPICMEQYEAPYMAYYVDELKDGKMFFIDDDVVKLYVTLGQKQQNRDRNSNNYSYSESTCIQKFDDRYTELKKTMQYLQ